MPPADTRRVFDSAPRGASPKLCLHVLSSFQRTGYLLACSRAFQRVRGQAPRQVNFLQGNLSILLSVSIAVNPFLVCSVDFFRGAFESVTPRRHSNSPFPAEVRARGATWELRAEGSVSTLRGHASSEQAVRYRAFALRRNGWQRSVQPIYAVPCRLSTQATAQSDNSAELA
jgi:hypothetical protein